MQDSEARFARRLGLAVGRWDWWRLKDEHTPYEWALQRLADVVDPLGENRADMRAGVAVASLLRQLVPEISGQALESIAEDVRYYLPVNQPDDDKILMPEEADAIKRGES